MSDTFDFRRFSVHQDRCAMKVGTDGVLLGAWASIPNNINNEAGAVIRVLDVGTGTGIISLMMAQRLDESGCDFQIDAIEIDASAAQQAGENFNRSPWKDRITVFPYALQSAEEKLFGQDTERVYDAIVSNPPFYNATLKPNDEQRAVARHKDSLPIAEIAKFAQRHLRSEGRLSLIYPSDYESDVQCSCIMHGLKLVRQTQVLTKEGKPCKRLMSEFVAIGYTFPLTLRLSTLSIRDLSGQYTEQYRQLCAPFYLHLK